MQTLEQMIAERDALQARIDAAQAVRSAEAVEAAKAVLVEYDYSVTWPHPAQFRVERKATPETLERIAAFVDRYGTAHAPRPFEGGMTYSCLIGDYVTSGGGSVIISWEGERSFDPSPFKPEWLASLRDGIVPDEIKIPHRKGFGW